MSSRLRRALAQRPRPSIPDLSPDVLRSALCAIALVIVLYWWVTTGAATAWPVVLSVVHDPSASFTVFVLAGVLWILTKSGVVRGVRRIGSHHRGTAIPMGTTSPVGNALPSVGTSRFDDLRRARHEAGHVVAARALGGTIIKADIRLRPPDSGGRTESSLPGADAVACAWRALVVSVAGAAVDLADGCRDDGCVSDLRAATDTAALLAMWGFRPPLQPAATDPWDLVRAALREARRLLDRHAGAVDRIAEAITTAHHTGRILRDRDLRALLDEPTLKEGGHE